MGESNKSKNLETANRNLGRLLKEPAHLFLYPLEELDEEPEELSIRQKWFPSFNEMFCEVEWGDDPKIRFSSVLRWIRTIGIAGALFYSAYQGIGNNIEYSRGQRIGIINKISEEGLFWKTREGQLSLEGKAIEFWNFSLDNSDKDKEGVNNLYAKIKTYSKEGQRVKITYKQPLAVWPWRACTKYLVQSVEPLESK